MPPALPPQNNPSSPTLDSDEQSTIQPQTLEELSAVASKSDDQHTIPPNSPNILSNVQSGSDQQDAGFPLVPGYRILHELGKGGMGVVYLAEQTKLHRRVALKMIRGGFVERQEQRNRFLIEAETVARLQHPNIVQIFEIGDIQHHDGTSSPFMALEYVAGKSLEDHLQGKPMPTRSGVELIVQLAQAMDYAHQQKLVHRDLKPANILLAPLEERHSKQLTIEILLKFARTESSLSFVPKITDFGLAKQIDVNSSQTKAGEIMGTPSYMAPEQAAARTDIGPAVDTYALGAILYELLTGRPPFRSFTSIDTIMQVLEDEPVPPSQLQKQVSHDVETICLKCLAKLPSKRYASCAELAEDLQRYLNHEPILARPAGLVERIWKWSKRRPTAAALLLVSLMALLTFVAGIIYFNQIVRGERDIAVEAKQDAQQQRDEARIAKHQADAKATETQRTLDFFAINTGLRHIDNNELYRGLLWCAKPLQETGPYRQPDTMLRERLGLHLQYAQRPTLQQLFFARGSINHGCFSPDDQQVALVSSDRTVQVYETATGKAVSPGIKNSGIEFVAFTPDGKQLVAVLGNKAQLYATTTWQAQGKPMVHDDAITTLRFSPDGNLFVTTSMDGTAKLWSASNGQQVGSTLQHKRPVHAAAFHKDGKLLATASGKEHQPDGMLKLWDVNTQQPVGKEMPYPDSVVVLAYDPMGNSLAGASFDGTLQLWDGTTGEPKNWKNKIGQLPRQILFDPHGTRLSTASQEWSVSVFDIATARLVQSLPHSDNVWGLEYSRDGKLLVSHGEDKSARVWDVATGKPLFPYLPHRGAVTHVSLSASGKVLLTCSDDGVARLWHLDSQANKPVELNNGKWVWAVDVSADGTTMASAGDSGMVRLWKLPTGEAIGLPMKFPREQLRSVVIHPNGKQVAASGEYPEAMVWHTATQQLAFKPLKHQRNVSSVCYSPDGNLLLTASFDGTAKLWSSATGELVKTLEHATPLTLAIFSPDGLQVLTTTVKGTAHLWNTASGQAQGIPWKHGEAALSYAAFSPNGQLAATTSFDFSTRLWNVITSEAIKSPMLHQYEAVFVDFHPSNGRLVTASLDKTARIWDATTTQSIGPPLQHQAWVLQAKFSPDGKLTTTISRDRGARFWDAENGQPLSPLLMHEGRIVTHCFSRDQKLLITGSLDNKARIWTIPKETRPTADLIELIELYDGHHLTTLGGLKQLDNEEMEASWKRLKAKYPSEFTRR